MIRTDKAGGKETGFYVIKVLSAGRLGKGYAAILFR